MNPLITLVFVPFFIIGCHKSPNNFNPVNHTSPTQGNNDSSQKNSEKNLDGTLVGNGGGEVGLEFTLTALKSIQYVASKIEKNWKDFEVCNMQNDETKLRMDSGEISRNQELQICIKPDVKVSQINLLKYLLKKMKVISVSKNLCLTTNDCTAANSLKTKIKKSIIYIDARKWPKSRSFQRVEMALFPYFKLANLLHWEAFQSGNIISEIYKDLFSLDFTIDEFRSYLDERNINIKNIGDLEQEPLKKQISLAINCIDLVEHRYPKKLALTDISLSIGEISYFSYEGFYYHERSKWLVTDWFRINSTFHNAARVYTYSNYRTEETRRELVLHKDANLQTCYNSLVLRGIKNWYELTDPLVIPDSTGIEMGRIDISETAIEFGAIALNSLNYIKNLIELETKEFKQCESDNLNGSCKKPTLNDRQIDKLSKSIAQTQIFSKSQKLCPKVNPECSLESSLIAVNLPEEKKIIVNIDKWKKLDKEAKIKIVLHEYFGIMGLEVDNYSYSTQFAPMIMLEVYSLDFSVDNFKNFLNKSRISILGNDIFDQITFRATTSITLECLRLVEKRYPNKLKLSAIKFKMENPYNKMSTEIEDNGYVLKLVGNNLSLQKCYNKIVAHGLKN